MILKKIDEIEQWLGHHLTLFRCPICQQPFVQINDHQMVCVNHHTLNINKHGYVYFLTRGVESEYDRQMLLARRSLLQAGMFSGILDAINQQIPSTPQTILDVGTGEGTPLNQLRMLRNEQQDTYVGFDISRAGVQLATQLSNQLFFCLADLRHLPFADGTFSTIIELFSPSDYHEFQRVLSKKGTVYKVIPSANYLKELRSLLYPTDDQHRTYDNYAVKQLFEQHYPHTRIQNISYQFTVPQNLKRALVQMSPLHWGQHAKKLTDVDLASLTRVSVDVDILQGNLK